MQASIRVWLASSEASIPVAATDTEVFARARLESVTVEETFAFEQEISRNRSVGRRGSPAGSITIVMPYDGYEYFTRDAAKDVERHLADDASTEDADALVGHLVLSSYQNTDLAEVLDLADRYGSVPVRVPIRAAGLDGSGALVADRHEYRCAMDYAPSADRPEILPIAVFVELEDPDNADLPRIDARSDAKLLDDVASKIMQYIGFRPILTLDMKVRLTLPSRRGGTQQDPIVRRVAVELPTVTSIAPSSLRLFVGGKGTDVQHNPVNRSLEWFDVETTPAGNAGEGEPRHFESPSMLMTFEQPGELFAQDDLVVEVDVEVPGELLSGTDARLFNALGRQYPRSTGTLTIRSRIASCCTVVLRDAFARRTLSPYQNFHFEEIIPETIRVADIATALGDQRFEVITRDDLPNTTSDGGLRQFLFATRTDGANTMELWVFVEGRRHQTERHLQQSGGTDYTTIVESGDLRIFVRGQVHRDTRDLIHEINELQLTLRDRFRRLRAPR